MGCGGAKGAADAAARPPVASISFKPLNDNSDDFKNPSASSKVVMGKYNMGMKKEDVTGEGSNSICRLGTEIATGTKVAIKVYKEPKKGKMTKEDMKTRLFQFTRQVEVLRFLQEPFEPDKIADKALWCAALASSTPEKLFMVLVDYSQDKDGKPAPFPRDGILYIVTELAQYSMKDFFASQRQAEKTMPKSQIQSVCFAILKVVAGLHAKGLVHLDLKPENLMMFNGHLKLIDVDGCVQLGSTVYITDSSISFSPIYCAPEWADFLISEDIPSITAAYALDVWSIGATVCELVTLNPILKGVYTNFLRNSTTHNDAGFLLLEWLSELKKCPLPKLVMNFDPLFVDLVSKWLLVCDKKKRKSCAQSLSHPYFSSLNIDEQKKQTQEMRAQTVPRVNRNRPEDDSKGAPLHKGILFKLDVTGDPQVQTCWRKRDVWLTQAGSICYFSIKESKRLVIVDGSNLAGGSVEPFHGSCMPHAFEVRYKSDDEDNQLVSVFFACESSLDCKVWIKKIGGATRMDIPTMNMKQVKDIRSFIVQVKNRRIRVSAFVDSTKDAFEPVFKRNLWKLKAEGDRTREDHWFEREMWISHNHSLVYYSKKDERNLVYYTAADLMSATVRISTGASVKPYGFQVQLPTQRGISFAPGEFASSEEASRDLWMMEFGKLQKKLSSQAHLRPNTGRTDQARAPAKRERKKKKTNSALPPSPRVSDKE